MWKTIHILPILLFIFISYACHFPDVILFLVPLISLIPIASPVSHPTPLYIGTFSPSVFLLLLCLLILSDVDSMHFYFSSIIYEKSLTVDPCRLSPTLCDFKNARTMFLYSQQHAIYFSSLMFFFFLLLYLCYFVIWVTKTPNKLSPLPELLTASLHSTHSRSLAAQKLVLSLLSTGFSRLLIQNLLIISLNWTRVTKNSQLSSPAMHYISGDAFRLVTETELVFRFALDTSAGREITECTLVVTPLGFSACDYRNG